MANKKELETLVSIAGKVDPSLQKSIKKASTQVNGLKKATKLAGVAVAAGIGAISAATVKAVKVASEYESAFAKTSTLIQGTKKELEEYSNEILKLSNSTGIAAEELADTVYNAISAGVSQEDAIEFSGKAAKLAKAGFTDATTAIDVLTTSINAYGLESEKASEISDMLIKTQNLGKTSVGELASYVGKVIPTASAYGVEMDNLCSTYARLTMGGIKTADATTYIKSMLNELGKSSSTVAKTLKSKTGKNFKELSQEGKSLADVLQILLDSVGGDSTKFNELWSSSEAGGGALALLNDGADNFNATLNEMRNSAGTTDEAYEKVTDTLEYQIQVVKNLGKNFMIGLGKKILPMIKSMGERVIPKLQSGMESMLDTIGPMLETIGNDVLPVLESAFQMIGSNIGDNTSKIQSSVSETFKLFGKTILKCVQVAGDIVPVLLDAFESILPCVEQLIDQGMGFVDTILPMILDVAKQVIPVVIELIEDIIPIIDIIFSTIKDILPSIFGLVKEIIPVISDVADIIFKVIKDVMKQIMPFISSMIKLILPMITDVISLISGVLDDLLPHIENIFGTVMDIVEDILPIIVMIANEILPIIFDIISENMPFVQELITNVLSIIESLLPVVQEFMKTILPVIFSLIKQNMPVIQSIIKTIFGFIQSIMPLFMQLIQQVLPVIVSIIEKIAPVIANILNVLTPIISMISEMISFFIPMITECINNLIPIITGIVSVILDVTSNIIDGLMPVIESIIDVIQGVISFITDVFRGNWEAAWNDIVGIFGSIFEGVINLCKLPINAVIGVINSVIDKINGFGFTIPDWVPGIGGKGFSLDIPEIPMLATGGFTEGVSIAGEAAQEAVISFDPRYRDDNLSYWAEAGRRLGANTDDFAISERTVTTSDVIIEGISFAPKIQITGDAKKQDVLEALQEAEEEFADYLIRLIEEKRGGSYAGSY